MKVLITFKAGGGAESLHRHYDFEQAEFDVLKHEFLAHTNDVNGVPRGGSYKCLEQETQQNRELVLRFDDILYFECIIPTPTPTGPLKNGTSLARTMGTQPLTGGGG